MGTGKILTGKNLIGLKFCLIKNDYINLFLDKFLDTNMKIFDF